MDAKKGRGGGSSGSGMAVGSGIGLMFDCQKCGRCLPLSQQSARKGICVADSNSYKSLSERWVKQRLLRTWWQGQTPEQQKVWYLKQHSIPSGSKRKFEDLSYSETTDELVADLNDEVDNVLPWAIFRRNGIIEGKSVPDLELEFKNIVEDPNTEAVWRRNQWLVPEFAGIRRIRREGVEQRSATSRSASVADADQLFQLRQSGRENLKTFKESIKDTAQPGPGDLPFVESSAADQPVRQVAADVIGLAIGRDVGARFREETMRAAFEADDVMMAGMQKKYTTGHSGLFEATSKSKSVTLEIIKTQGKLMEVQTKFSELKRTLKSDFKGVLDKCAMLFAVDSEQKETLGKVEQELAGLDVAMSHEVDRVVADLVSQEAELKTCVNLFEINVIRNGLSDILKLQNKNQIQAFKSKLKVFKDTLAREERSRKMRGQQIAVVDEAPVHPLYSILCELAGSVPMAPGSLFEAKGGLKGALVAVKPATDPTSELLKTPYLKKAYKDIGAHCKAHAIRWGVAKMSEVPKRKKIEKLLHKGFDSMIFTTTILPKNVDWADSIYAMQAIGMEDGFLHTGFTHLCSMEARFLIDGSEIVGGISTEAIPGHTIKDKRKFLYMSTVDTIKTLITASGWLLKHDNTQVLIIPTGFMVMMCSSGAVGLRWSMSSDDADLERVKLSLTSLLESFPEMRNPSTGHSQFLDFLCST